MKYKKIFSIILVVMFVFAVSGCSSQGNIVAKEAEKDVLRIGFIGPLSGQYAAIGIANLRSAQLAAKELGNIEIIAEDDKFDPKDAVSAYKKLKEVNNIDAVIVLATPSVEALKPIIEQDNMPTIALGQDLNTKRDYVFHIAESVFLPYVELGKDMSKSENPVFLVQESSWSEEIIANYKKGAGEDANIIRFNQDDSASTTILKLQNGKNGDYTIFSIDATPEGWIPMYNRIDDLNLDDKITHLLNYNEESNIRAQSFKDKVDLNFFEGKNTVTTKTGSNTDAEFLKRYKQEYGEDIIFFGDFGYDSVKLLKEVNPKYSNWIDRVQNYDFTGVTGRVIWDENGDRQPIIVRGYSENGTLIEVQ